jgi:hypothetical protein
MGIETSTVRTYLQWIFVKLGVRTRVQLALVAVMVGVVDGEMVVRAWERYAPEVLGSGSYRQMDVTGTGPGWRPADGDERQTDSSLNPYSHWVYAPEWDDARDPAGAGGDWRGAGACAAESGRRCCGWRRRWRRGEALSDGVVGGGAAAVEGRRGTGRRVMGCGGIRGGGRSRRWWRRCALARRPGRSGGSNVRRGRAVERTLDTIVAAAPAAAEQLAQDGDGWV